MDISNEKMLRPDSKGRITLGALAKGISGFKVSLDDQQRIILEPYTEIPAREKWLFDNSNALAKVKQGIKHSAEGRVKQRGSFSKYIEEKD
jgi:hypothetical protein